jgi:hypothetical protein
MLLMANAYNMLEPEYSKEFPLVKVDFIFPQIFDQISVLMTDHTISKVYFNGETNPDQSVFMF